MRCPKCGFVSYDLSESCVKCGKNISTASKELQGTVASVAAPPFLRFGFAETVGQAVQEGETESEMTFDLGGGEEEVVIDLGGEAGPSALEAQPLDFGSMETAAEPVDLGGAGEKAGEEAAFAVPEEPPPESFEISDLAPPQEAALPMEDVVEGQELVVPEEPKSAGAGLADLKVEGIDLESSPAKGKVMPSVKTGTALDEFDIDLDDLIPKKK